MTSEVGSHRVTRALAAAAVATLLVVVSCESPVPTEGEGAATDAEQAWSRAPVELDGRPILPRSEDGRQPLVLVDGEIRTGTEGLGSLRLEEIERIEVVRGAAATERYGDRAEHGVIHITTTAAAGATGSAESGPPREGNPLHELEPTGPGKASPERPSAIPYDTPPRLKNPGEVQRALAAAYPADVRAAGVGGRAVLWIYIDGSGRVGAVRVKESSGRAALDDAAREVARAMAFAPAELEGEPTPVWVAQPITFETQ